MTKPKFTKEETKRLRQLAYTTWDYVAGDVLRSLEDDGRRAEMRRAHVIEIVLDADYMEMAARKEEDRELLKRFRELDYRAMKRMVRPAFQYASYGW